MISYKEGNTKFNYRVAGVAIKDNKVLLHKPDKDDFWTLPGGRGEMFETSIDTIEREIKEELNEVAKVDRLLWIIENFFEYNGEKYHELSMYYLINFDVNSRMYINDEIKGIEIEKKMTFKWFDIETIETQSVQPVLLKEELKDISNNVKHIIHK